MLEYDAFALGKDRLRRCRQIPQIFRHDPGRQLKTSAVLTVANAVDGRIDGHDQGFKSARLGMAHQT